MKHSIEETLDVIDGAIRAHREAYSPGDVVQPMLQQMIEEMAELITEISHVLRRRNDLMHPKFLEEWADVELCVRVIGKLAEFDWVKNEESVSGRREALREVMFMKAVRAASRLEAIAAGRRERPVYGHT